MQNSLFFRYHSMTMQSPTLSIVICILFFVAQLCGASHNESYECPYAPICNCLNNSLICENFDYFKDLNFGLTRSSSKPIFTRIKINPRRSQVLDERTNNLDLTGLSVHSNAIIEISNIESFSILANPLKNLNNMEKRFTLQLEITNSVFKFTHKGNSIDCQLDEFDGHDQLLLASAYIVSLINTSFPEPLCPLLFRHAKIAHLYITNPRNSFEFLLNKPKTHAESINSSVKYLTIRNASFEKFDGFHTLNSHVFHEIRTLHLDHVTIDYIDENTFCKFNSLTKLELKLDNWPSFLTDNQMKWAHSLNHNIKKADFTNKKSMDLRKKILMELDGRGKINYTFPLEDICLFKDFPFERLVFPYVKFDGNNCSCTLYWLLQYREFYEASSEFGFSSSSICTQSNNFCDFSTLFKQCKPKFSQNMIGPTILFIIFLFVGIILLVVGIRFIFKRCRTLHHTNEISVRRTRLTYKPSDDEISINSSSNDNDVNNNLARKSASTSTLKSKFSKRSQNRNYSTDT